MKRSQKEEVNILLTSFIFSRITVTKSIFAASFNRSLPSIHPLTLY